MPTYNIAAAFAEQAALRPQQAAIILPAGRSQGRARFQQMSFQQLHELSDRYAHGLSAAGLQRGERALMLVRPGIDLIAIVFALFKIGAVPVLIDPGMGRQAFLQCVQETEPTAFIGIPLGHLLRWRHRRAFATVKRAFTAGNTGVPGAPAIGRLPTKTEPFPIVATGTEDEGVVAFTSGSTGIPKGVVYLQGMLEAQLAALTGPMGIQPGEVHLAAVYVFALYNPPMGVTTVIPDMDPRRTAALDPARFMEFLDTFAVDFSMGSPTVWSIVGRYCEAQGIRPQGLQRIYMFGAPASPQLLEQWRRLLPEGQVYTPYGATEALPLTNIDSQTLAASAEATRRGEGVCVGEPLPGLDAAIIPIHDEPIERWQGQAVMGPGEVGEIVVRGPVVTREYLHRPAQTQAAKIIDNQGIWHRMGDIGYRDEQGRLWFCGRKSHRVETEHGRLLSSLEALFDDEPSIHRSALVGVGPQGKQRPVLILEFPDGRLPDAAQQGELTQRVKTIAAQHPLARWIETVLFHGPFPVDVRHNAKIQREKLARWAEEQLI